MSIATIVGEDPYLSNCSFLYIHSAVGSDRISLRENPSITIIAPRALLEDTVSMSAISDVVNLLREGFPDASVTINDGSAKIRLILPRTRFHNNVIPRFARGRDYPYLVYPDHDYEWRSTEINGRIRLTLNATSHQGICFALYGLLQEKLGFRFYHPKRTLIPSHNEWPLPPHFQWRATPRFDKKGFHLHTLHPMELTEQMHDPTYPDALSEVKEYIDWLVRNGQNTFQFYLLREIDRERWINHAKAVCDYAHRRGVMIGVQISLSMLQQQAFQMVKLMRPYPSYRRQVDRNLAWLFQARWDFVTVEPTMGEYLLHLGHLKPDIMNYLFKEITERYHAKAMLATHVIRPAGERRNESAVTELNLDPSIGILIHTVMCYSLCDPKAPVYGNINQSFMLERGRRETLRRETWYWPESSYWVAFDTPVPLFLLTYLDARKKDMETIEHIGVANNLTFSSGWEWGYWLIDWSIARNSWRYCENGRPKIAETFDSLQLLFPDKKMDRLWSEALEIQNHYLKERELMKFMAALTPFSEFPRSLRIPFQPEPEFTYSWLIKDAPAAKAQALLQGPTTALDEYAERMEGVCDRLEQEIKKFIAGRSGETIKRRALAEELIRGLRVTSLRARHRSLTLKALVAKRKALSSAPEEMEGLLAQAAEIRERALRHVRLQEELYRYPFGLVAARRKDHTAYGFGYLYPVHDLFFWRREEEQVRQGRFDPIFMNIWDFRRIVGVGSLIF